MRRYARLSKETLAVALFIDLINNPAVVISGRENKDVSRDWVSKHNSRLLANNESHIEEGNIY